MFSRVVDPGGSDMALADAIKHYYKQAGDPESEWVDELRAAAVIEQVYADMPDGSGAGTQWFVGTGGVTVTDADLSAAKPGDFYLDLATFDVWRFN